MLLIEGQSANRVVFRVKLKCVRHSCCAGDARDGNIARSRHEDNRVVGHIARVVVVGVRHFRKLRLHNFVGSLTLPRGVKIQLEDVPTTFASQR